MPSTTPANSCRRGRTGAGLLALAAVAWSSACAGRSAYLTVAAGPAAASATGAVVLALAHEVDLDADGSHGWHTERRAIAITAAEGAHHALQPTATGAAAPVRAARARRSRAGSPDLEVQAAAGAPLQLPDVRPGDRVDVWVRREVLVPAALPPLVLGGPDPVRCATLRVGGAAALPPQLVAGQGTLAEPTWVQRREAAGRVELALTRHDLAARPAALDAALRGPWAIVLPPLPGAGAAAAGWAPVAQWLAAWVAPSQRLPAAALKAAATGLERRQVRQLAAAMHVAPSAELLQPAPRPPPPTGAAAPPATPLEVAAVAVAASAGAPLQARLALVAPLGGVPLMWKVPGLYALRGALVAFRGELGNTWSFADPLCADCATGQVGAQYAGAPVLVLGGEGAELTSVPLSATPASGGQIQFDWQLTVAGALHGSAVAELRGAAAVRGHAALTAAAPSAARAELARQLLFDPATPPTVEGVEHEGGPGDEAGASTTAHLSVQGAGRRRGRHIALPGLRALAGDALFWRPSAAAPAPAPASATPAPEAAPAAAGAGPLPDDGSGSDRDDGASSSARDDGGAGELDDGAAAEGAAAAAPPREPGRQGDPASAPPAAAAPAAVPAVAVASLLPGPAEHATTATLQLPEGAVVTLPAPLLLQAPFASYEARLEQDEQVLVFTRRLRLLQRLVDARQAEALAHFVAAVEAYEARPLEVEL